MEKAAKEFYNQITKLKVHKGLVSKKDDDDVILYSDLENRYRHSKASCKSLLTFVASMMMEDNR